MNGVQSRAADRESRTATDNDTHLQWLIGERFRMVESGFVGKNVEVLAMWSGSMAEAFGKSGQPRRKVIDACFRPLGVTLPTLVVMSGWSDMGEDMFRDMRDYMKRGNGIVRTVIILKWHVEGVAVVVVSCQLKVYEYTRNRPDGRKYVKTRDEEILPGVSCTGGIKIRLGDICSTKLPPGEDAKKEYSMSLPRLRNIALRFIREDKFRPDGSDDLGSEDSDEVESDEEEGGGGGEEEGGGGGGGGEEEEGGGGEVAIVPNNSLVLRAGSSRSGNNSDIYGNYSGNSGSNNTFGSNNIKGNNNVNGGLYSGRKVSVFHFNVPEDFLTHSLRFTAKKKLEAFFKASERFLKQLARRGAATGKQVCDDMQVSYEYIPDMINVALYDTVILCDDSGSMKKDGRYDLMRRTVLQVSDVCTAFRDEGISIKFLNFKEDKDYNGIHDKETLNQVINAVIPRGGTRLGTVLRDKIVEPLIIQKAKEKLLDKPVLVTIITDGQPAGEDRGELKRTILNCKRELAELEGPGGELYGGSAVVFQISLVGNSEGAKSYIQELEEDPEIRELVYCTRERLDVVKSEMSDPQYTGWLIQLLAAGIEH